MSVSTTPLSDSLLNHGQSREVTPAPFRPTSSHASTGVMHAIRAHSGNLQLATLPVQAKSETLKEVIQEYVDKLSDDDRVAFLSAPDIIKHLHEIRSNGEPLITNSLTTRVEKVLQCVKNFMGSLAIVHPEISAFVVGGANCILMVCPSNIYL